MIANTAARTSASMALQSTLSNDIAKLQNQVDTGKRLSQASDDPAASAQIGVIRQLQADDTAYQSNVDSASATAMRADGAMSSVTTSLTQALQLVTQAANGTGNADGRAAISAQLRSLAQDIGQVAAQKDTNGQPLFPAGAPNAIPIADGVAVPATVSKTTLLGSTMVNGSSMDMVAMLNAAADAIGATSDSGAASTAAPYLSAVQAASDQLTKVQAEQGVRAATIDARSSAIKNDQTSLGTQRSGLEDADVASALSLIASKMTTLQAAQAVFAKVNSRTLFDVLG
jgi:flagellar hook-associated protein 3 FlgL